MLKRALRLTTSPLFLVKTKVDTQHREHFRRCSKPTPKDCSLLESYTPLLIGVSLLAAQHFIFPSEALAAVESLKSDGHPDLPAEVYRLAENEDFWANLARYGRFFFSVVVGTAYTTLKPLAGLLKRPLTAAVIVGVIVVVYFFVKSTLQGMLGLSDFDYPYQ